MHPPATRAYSRLRWVRQLARLGVGGSCLLMLVAGCGPVLITGDLRGAESRLAKAREVNAGWYAPFEFHYALAHLTKAREEAAEASYEDALRYARTAEEYARKAIELSRERRRGGP